MRKIAKTLLIVFLLIFACSGLVACKDESREYKTNISDTDIAKLSLFTYDGSGESVWGLMNLGHSFLSIENVSSENIKLLNKTIEPGETIAIGTWSILEHFGVWYNVESNYIVQHNKYDGRLSITIGIGEDDIEKISSFIAEKDTWNPINNCSYFALNLWNKVAGETEYIKTPFIYTPSYIAEEMKKFDSFEKNKDIPTEDTMGYFKGETYVSFQIEGDNYESV